MRAASPSDRPTLASSRRTSWKAFLFQEWGLLLLAAALAVIIWDITSRRVVKPRPLDDIEVQLEVDEAIRDQVGAVLIGSADGKITMDFELTCSERERNEALAGLDRDGRPVVIMRVTEPPASDSRALKADTDRYAWPFANHRRILSPGKVKAPEGKVFLLAPANPRVDWLDEETATIPTKSELKERGIRVDMTFSRDTVSVMRPRDRAKDAAYEILSPDPINLASIAGPLVADGDIPFDSKLSYDLTFEAWRTPSDPAEAAWRRQLNIPRIKATVTLTQIGQKEIQNSVIVELPQEFQSDPDRTRTPGLTLQGKLLFTGTLRGPQKVLDLLKKDLSGWGWGIAITDPSDLPDGTMGDGPSPWKTVGARFFWYANKPEFRDRGIEFVPAKGSGQDAFDIKVRWNKRGK